MSETEFMDLVKFLGEVQEKYYTEYKIKKGQEQWKSVRRCLKFINGCHFALWWIGL